MASKSPHGFAQIGPIRIFFFDHGNFPIWPAVLQEFLLSNGLLNFSMEPNQTDWLT
jgi:hypothetical protein